jgi:signal peptidase I
VELTPVPSRPPLGGRLWLLVAAAVLTPLILFALLPTALDLHRYVVTTDAMGGALPRGSLTFAQEVPRSDLHVGDVITFRPPVGASTEGLVTRRVAEVSGSAIRTRADTDPALDPWTLPVDGTTARVVAHVPYVGYPFIGAVDRWTWLMVAVVPLTAVGLAVAGDVQRGRRRRRTAGRASALRATTHPTRL